jgi:hypothetical protein
MEEDHICIPLTCKFAKSGHCILNKTLSLRSMHQAYTKTTWACKFICTWQNYGVMTLFFINREYSAINAPFRKPTWTSYSQFCSRCWSDLVNWKVVSTFCDVILLENIEKKKIEYNGLQEHMSQKIEKIRARMAYEQ